MTDSLSFSVSRDKAIWLRAEAKRRGISLSTLLREAISAFLAAHQESSGPCKSLLVRAPGWVPEKKTTEAARH
jgi:hypothetical protein